MSATGAPEGSPAAPAAPASPAGSAPRSGAKAQPARNSGAHAGRVKSGGSHMSPLMRLRAAQMAKTAGSGLKKKPAAGAAAAGAGAGADAGAGAPAGAVAGAERRKAKKGDAKAEERPWWVVPAALAGAFVLLSVAFANAFNRAGGLPSSV